jgi:hypothetical protein
MGLTLACHSCSHSVAGLETWVDRSMVAFVVDVDVGAAGVDYGKAGILACSELADSGMVA